MSLIPLALIKCVWVSLFIFYFISRRVGREWLTVLGFGSRYGPYLGSMHHPKSFGLHQRCCPEEEVLIRVDLMWGIKTVALLIGFYCSSLIPTAYATISSLGHSVPIRCLTSSSRSRWQHDIPRRPVIAPRAASFVLALCLACPSSWSSPVSWFWFNIY